MKYKHGFIGNSSSASYYIRRGRHSSRYGSSGLVSTGNNIAAKNIKSVAHAIDSYYSWHPARRGVMHARMVIPIGNGDKFTSSPSTGVKEISFYVYGVIRPGHDAAWNIAAPVNGEKTPNAHNASVFTTGVNWAN